MRTFTTWNWTFFFRFIVVVVVAAIRALLGQMSRFTSVCYKLHFRQLQIKLMATTLNESHHIVIVIAFSIQWFLRRPEIDIYIIQYAYAHIKYFGLCGIIMTAHNLPHYLLLSLTHTHIKKNKNISTNSLSV